MLLLLICIIKSLFINSSFNNFLFIRDKEEREFMPIFLKPFHIDEDRIVR